MRACAAGVGTRGVELMRSRDSLIAAIEDGMPGARLTGHRTERPPHHASFVVEGVSGEALLVTLDAAGYAVSSGSACRAGQSGPSPVLLEMGYDPELAQSVLRFTLPAPSFPTPTSRASSGCCAPRSREKITGPCKLKKNFTRLVPAFKMVN